MTPTELLTRARLFALTAIVCVWGVQAMAADGLITMRSSYGPKDTMNRLEAEVKAKGMTVFARIDHAAGATEVGLSLRPTELLIFGNARAGTPLMQSTQMIGIDLPLKVLVWQDEGGNTWLSYNDPSWLAKRHGLGHEVEAAVRPQRLPRSRKRQSQLLSGLLLATWRAPVNVRFWDDIGCPSRLLTARCGRSRSDRHLGRASCSRAVTLATPADIRPARAGASSFQCSPRATARADRGAEAPAFGHGSRAQTHWLW
jgi:uncharacterized protein (DUF302 family)